MSESSNSESYKEHELYYAAMKEMASGDQAQAAAKLRELVKIYPKEQVLRDLLVRAELQATLTAATPAAPTYRSPAPGLRRILLLLLVVTVGLVIVAGFAAAYDRIVRRQVEQRQQEQEIESLRRDGQARLEKGDWSGARQACEDLLVLAPGDPEAVACIELSRLQEMLAQQYDDAVAAEHRGDSAIALDLLRQIESQSPGFRDVPERIQDLEELERLEVIWQQSESLIQAGDWRSAIAALEQIRAQNLDFRRSQVEQQLSQVYAQLARDLIGQAQGAEETLREAAGYLEKALALRPTEQGLQAESRLVADYLAGAEAADRGEWAQAVAHWEAVYATRSDYQGGGLRQKLSEAYPLAAKELVYGAKGGLSALRQAADYYDRALGIEPGDQGLIEERQLVRDYIAGAEAYDNGQWDMAITYWGAIYGVRPQYQDGKLEELLRQACENSQAPDSTLCPP